MSQAESVHDGKAVAIFFWEGYLGVAPSLLNAIQVFVDTGYQVDVITRVPEAEYAQPPQFPDAVRVLYLQKNSGHSGHSARTNSIGEAQFHSVLSTRPVTAISRRMLRKLMGGENYTYWAERLRYLRFGRACTAGRRYQALIGVDTEGLVAATVIGALLRRPVLYWSLEIRFLSEYRSAKHRVVKRLERLAHRRAELTIIQDWKRAESLSQENGVGLERFQIVPNAPLGPAPHGASQYFRDMFGMPDTQTIILQTGMITREAMSLELATVAATWPSTWTLILHDRARRDPNEPYLRAVQEAGGDRVLLSLDPVPYDQLDALVASGDIGLALYAPDLGPNFALMAGASGKLGHYLRCGLPVICSDIPGVDQLFGRYACGLVVRDMMDMEDALRQILGNYRAFSAEASRAYQEEMEFGVHFRPVVKFVEQLS